MLNFLWVLIFSYSFAQEKISAVLYDLNSNQTKKLYTLDIELTPKDSVTSSQVFYRDLDGKVVVHETGLFSGDELQEYTIERPQTNEKGRIQVREGRVFFEYEGADGKKKIDDEKLKGQVLCSTNFNAFVRKNWEQLSAGKAFSIRYAVWDRRETVGFTLEKMGESEHDGKKWLEIRMKPTSFVIAALVDPVHLWYSMDDKKLLLLKGRVPAKKQIDGHWKDLDAEVVYAANTKDQTAVSK